MIIGRYSSYKLFINHALIHFLPNNIISVSIKKINSSGAAQFKLSYILVRKNALTKKKFCD